MILNFEEMRLKLLTGEAKRSPTSSYEQMNEAMEIARHDTLRQVLEYAVSYTCDAVLIEYLRHEIENIHWSAKAGA